MESPSRVANIARYVGFAALACFAGAPTLIQLGVLDAGAGWRIFMLSWLFALVALVLGVLGLWLTRPAAGRAGRERAASGAIAGFAILGVLAVAGAGAFGLPVINDITTDTENPPAFVAARAIPENAEEDFAYPGEPFAIQQKLAYPDLVPIELDVTPAEAMARVEEGGRELHWETTEVDREAGRIEMTKTSGIFKFVDDIVIRVRPAGAGAVVDVRSRSRLGQGDLGANAGHIRAIRSKLEG